MDRAIFAVYEVPSFYDSMVGKLIVRGVGRHEAIARGRRALEEYRLKT